ncbi:MAG: MFS transporter [Gammaproteobacteria bacterium]|nr:MFS transporter [Gammaproteobacteria bacterium]MBT6584754.1 MFS transporter [Gammaproteobacteria bacterium]MDG1231941.1 MFS transporter [Pseudomonadales bacterium]
MESEDHKLFSKPTYQWYVVILLTTVYVFNFIDRNILAILGQSIKDDLMISDTAFGFLGGIAFAIFYTFMGIPIARLADRKSRKTVLAVCLAIWSGMTAVCGLAQNFTMLLLARIGVAIGEAGGSPPSHSIISDLFPVSRRATALGIYALGIPIGSAVGFLAGGWINEIFGWRTAFFVVGIPGLLLALVVYLTIKEPPRGFSERVAGQASPTLDDEPPPVMDVLRLLWSKRSFRYMSIGGALHAFVGNGIGLYIPMMFQRSHGLGTGEIGTWLFVLGFFGMAGTFGAGYLCDRLGDKDRRWYMWLPGIMTLMHVPFAAFTYLYHDPQIALMIYAVAYILGHGYLAPTFAMTQSLVPLRMRALAASILLFILNIIGLGLGPQITGILSDTINLTTDLGVDSLRWAMVSVLVFNIISAVLYIMAGRTVVEDMR